ncbi:hypoxanthine phosphoribosyltransferase [Candidatus Sumerlaeota bacterium]|nr:hypoxanthine phosphoribosyltransferase [Candidatus Sumerlaeota bacterium]
MSATTTKSPGSTTTLRGSRNLDDDIEEVLLTQKDIASRVAEIGKAIENDYRGKPLALIGILRGGLVFLSDLTRAISIPHSFDMVGASSYGTSTTSSGRVQITKDVEVDLRGKHVIICEDIYDSGRTLAAIRDLLRVHHPASVEVAAFLYKKVSKRISEVEIKYKGYDIEDKFVVGYGLDYAEIYRNLPYVGVLKRSIYESTK